MATQLVISVIADDRPGLVDLLSEAVADAGGNWCESRMAHLAEKFAGIVRVELPDSTSADRLKDRFASLAADGIHITLAETRAENRAPGVAMALEIVGPDQPGIVQEITHCLAQHRVSIESMETNTQNAPMGGGMIFQAHFEVSGPPDVDQDLLHGDLERIANALIVDLTIGAIAGAG